MENQVLSNQIADLKGQLMQPMHKNNS